MAADMKGIIADAYLELSKQKSVDKITVKNVTPVRTTKYIRECRTAEGHEAAFTYRCQLGI